MNLSVRKKLISEPRNALCQTLYERLTEEHSNIKL